MYSKEQKRANLNDLLRLYGDQPKGTFVTHWQHVASELEKDLARPNHMSRYCVKQRKQWLRIANDNLVALVRDAMEV